MCADVLASLQTPPGKGGIAVVLLKGPGAGLMLDRLFTPRYSRSHDLPGLLQLGALADNGAAIDEVVVRRFDGSVEVNLHGGPAVVKLALEAFARAGARVVPTNPADVFEPSHPRWNNPAIGGEMLHHLGCCRSPLALEALTTQWSAGLSELCASALKADCRISPDRLRSAAAGLDVMTKILNPPEVVIAGPANAGKSTLVNALVGRPVSIVNEQAGTTRDWVRVLTLFMGLPVWLTDTAGLMPEHAGLHDVDVEAMQRARQRAAQADLVLLVQDRPGQRSVDGVEGGLLLHVASKCDVAQPWPGADVAVCAEQEMGLDDLRKAVLTRLGLWAFDPSTPRAFTGRQHLLLMEAAGAIEKRAPREAAAALQAILTL
ncbi:MAG: hypothetical protein GXY38_04965 [Planctomycetes bacterium]|nr:hypothetical protein [Planctomycetota bacterium]